MLNHQIWSIWLEKLKSSDHCMDYNSRQPSFTLGIVQNFLHRNIIIFDILAVSHDFVCFAEKFMKVKCVTRAEMLRINNAR